MKERAFIGGVLALTLFGCNSISKEQAESAVAAYYAADGRVECEVRGDVVANVSVFTCGDSDCRRCANALLGAGMILKTERGDVYRFLRSAMNVDVKNNKAQLYCARKSGTVTSVSSKGDFGNVSVEETVEPDAKVQAVDTACGFDVPKRETHSRNFRVQRDGDGWKVLH